MLAFNESADVELKHIGRAGLEVMLIDNVLRDPVGVAAFGFAQPYIGDSSNLYPGMRAAMPESFSSAFRAWITQILQQQDVLESDQSICRDLSYFSYVSTARTDLLPIQCIPHFDSTDPNLWAAVIYLCDARFGGTAFYRHRRTGYEEITRANLQNYQVALNHDMRVHGAPTKAYMNGDTSLFEMIFSSELKFNRAIVYPGRALHAARIAAHFEPPKSRDDWRLTITALLHAAS